MADATVTLEREAVIDLLVEAHAVIDILEAVGGVCPTPITEDLTELVESIAEVVLGAPGDQLEGDTSREMLWNAGRIRARELLAELAGKEEAGV